MAARRCGGIFVLVLLLALGACADDRAEALAADHMASATPANGDLVDTFEKDSDGGGLLGKPSPAQVRRSYSFRTQRAARLGLDQLQREAEESGWSLVSVAPDGTGFGATRSIDGRVASLTVALNLDPDRPPAPGVVVLLSSTEG